MTQQEQKRLMTNVFGAMMVGGHYKDQRKMTSILKAIHHLLGTQEHLSAQECDDCLLYFFQEYAKGCSESITDSYIKANMIPIVKAYPSMDMTWGLSLLMSAKKFQKH
jgi:hypothetical protein